MTLTDLYAHLKEALGDQVDEYFSRMYDYDQLTLKNYTKTRRETIVKQRGFDPLTHTTDLDQTRYRWIAVFPATGSSEGHYVHVDLVWQREYEEGRVALFLGKTFNGMEHAITMANTIIRTLEKAGYC